MVTHSNGVLEVAHRVPGRTRLRQRGSTPLPPALLERLRTLEPVRQVDYRPSSRSLVLLHAGDFGLDDLRALTDEFDLELQEPPPPTQAVEEPSSRRPPGQGAKEFLMADVEAVLLIGLMAAWIRDLVVSRTFRIGTVLLLVLTGLNLYQFWQRRQQSRREVEEEEQPLEWITAP